MTAIKLLMDDDFGSTPVSNLFIDKHLPGAPPSFVLVYIWVLRHCYNAGKKSDTLTNAQIGEKLNLLETDVVNAWKYWEKEGLIKVKTDPSGGMTITYLSLHKPARKKRPKKTRRLKFLKNQFTVPKSWIYA